MIEMISSLLGVAGSIMLAVPSIKRQRILNKYHAFLSHKNSNTSGALAAVTQELDKAAENARNDELERFKYEWRGVNYYSVMVGAGMLALSFALSFALSLFEGFGSA